MISFSSNFTIVVEYKFICYCAEEGFSSCNYNYGVDVCGAVFCEMNVRKFFGVKTLLKSS